MKIHKVEIDIKTIEPENQIEPVKRGKKSR